MGISSSIGGEFTTRKNVFELINSVYLISQLQHPNPIDGNISVLHQILRGNQSILSRDTYIYLTKLVWTSELAEMVFPYCRNYEQTMKKLREFIHILNPRMLIDRFEVDNSQIDQIEVVNSWTNTASNQLLPNQLLPIIGLAIIFNLFHAYIIREIYVRCWFDGPPLSLMVFITDLREEYEDYPQVCLLIDQFRRLVDDSINSCEIINSLIGVIAHSPKLNNVLDSIERKSVYQIIQEASLFVNHPNRELRESFNIVGNAVVVFCKKRKIVVPNTATVILFPSRFRRQFMSFIGFEDSVIIQKLALLLLLFRNISEIEI